MPRYEVNLRQWQLMETVITVDAPNAVEARRLAKNLPYAVDWGKTGTFGPITAAACHREN